MGKRISTLTAREVDAIKAPGSYADGSGLYLQVAKGGARSWIYRYQLNDRRREMGMGPVGPMTLAAARKRAADARQQIADGIDPIDARREAEARRREEATHQAEPA